MQRPSFEILPRSEGKRNASFTALTTNPTVQTIANLTASYAGITRNASLAVDPAATTAVPEVGASAFAIALDPRPVRGLARVTVSLPVAGEFDLRVFDVAGRAIETLAAGRWPAGARELTWNAGSLAGGVYFARARLSGVGDRVTRFVVVP